MKLLLTSAGFTNQTIIDAFRAMLNKPSEESNIVVIPTGQNMVKGDKSWVFNEDFKGPYELGWKQFDIVNLIPDNEDGNDIAAGQMSDKTIGLVDFGFRPHFGENRRSSITGDVLTKAVAQSGLSVYALDDNSALSVVDGQVEVVTEGKWQLFQP